MTQHHHSPNCCRLPRTIAQSARHHHRGERQRRNVKFLARSIVLLWYLGSWYEPADLKNKVASPKVVSAKAYTQGLVWQIAGAHPMGYSNLQFGYWSRDPHDPNSPGLFSPAKP